MFKPRENLNFEETKRNNMTLPQYIVLATAATAITITAVYAVGTTDFSKGFEPTPHISMLERKLEKKLNENQ